MAGESKYSTYREAISNVYTKVLPKGEQYVEKVLNFRQQYKNAMADAENKAANAATQMESAREAYQDLQQQINQASQEKDGGKKVEELQSQAYRVQRLFNEERNNYNAAIQAQAKAKEGLQQTNERAKQAQKDLDRVVQYCNNIIQGVQQEMRNRQAAKQQFDRAAQTKFGRSSFQQSLELDEETKRYGNLIHACNECIRSAQNLISALDEGEEREREKVLTR